MNLVHEYWRKPNDDRNQPLNYARFNERSDFLLQILKPHIRLEDRILEPGCNVGRNLNALYQEGYRNLSGVDINGASLEMARQIYPEMSANACLYPYSLEEWIDLNTSQYDAIFTLSFLRHVHPNSEWLFGRLAEKTARLLVTIENETDELWNTFPRDYGPIFERCNFKQLIREDAPQDVLPNHVARVFVRL